MCCVDKDCYCTNLEIDGRHVGHAAFNINVLFEDDEKVISEFKNALSDFKSEHRKYWLEDGCPETNDDEFPF